MRHHEAIERAQRTLAMPYGSSARVAVREGLAWLASNDFSSTSHEQLDAIEHALDMLDETLARYVVDVTQTSERAMRYAHLGAPSSSAEPCSDLSSGFSEPAVWNLAVVDTLRKAMAEWALQIRGETIVDAHPEGVALFFDHDGAPFRLEIDARPFREKPDTYFSEASLVGESRQARAPISVRPKTFGDDLLATLRIRRDITFDDASFDPLYFVAGDEAVLREVLTPEVRAAFVEVAKDEPASVEMCDAVATLRLANQRLESACALLASLLPRG